MATQKPIATISYNTEPFLKEKLEEMLKAHLIQAYMYIKHKGEDGDKDHIHLRIEPNKKLDPMDIAEQLQEYPRGAKKPLGVRPFRPSKEEDWILYAVHDKGYLNHKYGGLENHEKLPYDWRQIVVPENYDLEVAWIRAKQYAAHTPSSIVSRIKQGEKPVNLVEQGENVFTINAVMRSLQDNDYLSIVQENQELKRKLEVIQDGLKRMGLELTQDEDGCISIQAKKE